MFLLDNERIISQSDEKIITLTNKRIRYTDSMCGKAHIVSIMLKKVSSIEVRYRSNIWFIYLAILSIIIGYVVNLSQGEEGFVLFGLGLGIVFIIFYLASRKHFITISSNGKGDINFHTKGMKKDIILDFINKVEKAIVELK